MAPGYRSVVVNTRRIILPVLALLLAAPVIAVGQAPAAQKSATVPPAPPPPPPPLVELRNLTVRDLRTTYIQLDSTQTVTIEATGAQPQGRSGVRRFLDHGIFQSKEDQLWDKDAWPGNAWILDARTRRVVWELRAADAVITNDGLVSFSGGVRLERGVYEVYYSALFPVSRLWEGDNDWRIRSDAKRRTDELHGPYLDDGSINAFRIALWGTGRKVTAQAAAEERDRTAPLTLAAHAGERQGAGFEVTRPVAVELYGVGERVEESWEDYGWIRDLNDQRIVWSFKTEPSRAAGGAAKNREVRDTMTLAAGRYLAYYAADDSHHPGEWDETPPHDPAGWGLSVRVVDLKDRAAIKPFEYKPVTGTPIVQFTRLGDDEFRFERFALLKPLDVHIFAVGEGSGQVLADRGWLVDSAGRAVWRMQGDNTQPAGGSSKNRVFDGTVRLDAGTYTAYFVTDDSHSAGGGWNTSAPFDGDYWGITITLADPAVKPASVVTRPADAPGPSVLARIDRVRSNAHERARFQLAADGPVRVRALGEGANNDMNDYGWIEDATGRTVWEMSYDDTEAGGGATKNRRIDAVVRLKAGEYTVHYQSDGSHALGDWNATMPDDPLNWGISVTRVR